MIRSAKTLIIGGGLSGLYAAHLLHNDGADFRLLEARADFGGRIRTQLRGEAAIELGPSWFWPEAHPRMTRFVRDFDLPWFTQYTKGDAIIDHGDQLHRQPHREIDPRIAGRLINGSRSLVDSLRPDLPVDHLHSGCQVKKITKKEDHLAVLCELADGSETSFEAEKVIFALPLRLLAETVTFEPSLPPKLLAAFHRTPTWMAAEAKFFALYDSPFWREEKLSGTTISTGPDGPLGETHDASHPSGGGALFGFLKIDYAERKALGSELVPACLAQLSRYFGPAASAPISTEFIDWSAELFTASSQEPPLQTHPIYGLPEDAKDLWEGRLKFAGTEAAPQFGGYLEGALEAAEAAIDSL